MAKIKVNPRLDNVKIVVIGKISTSESVPWTRTYFSPVEYEGNKAGLLHFIWHAGS